MKHILIISNMIFVISIFSIQSYAKKEDVFNPGDNFKIKISEKEYHERFLLLKETANKLREFIIKEDINGILSLVDNEGGISSIKNSFVYKKDLEKDLKEKGNYYCLLFGCKDLKQQSVKQKLLNNNNKFEVSLEPVYDLDNVAVFYLNKSKNEKRVNGYFEGDYEKPELIFRYKNKSWYILSLFEK